MSYKIKFQWDEEAKVWIATSKDIPGLILEHENKDTLKKRAQEAITELQSYKLNQNNTRQVLKKMVFI